MKMKTQMVSTFWDNDLSLQVYREIAFDAGFGFKVGLETQDVI